MHVLLSGGTGLIGTALCRYWVQQGHQLTVWSRNPARVHDTCGVAVRGVAQLSEIGDEKVDAVINLAGAPIADRPWTNKRKALLRASRIDLTAQLLDWLAQREQLPGVLISGSAVGWYGDGGDQMLTEDSAPVSADFATQLCADWEAQAQRAEAMGMRVVLLRTGLVLAKQGGFLKRLLMPFKLGVGGRIGDGQQWMPWIHISDQVALIDFVLNQPQASGVYNACAPAPLRNIEFTKALGSVLHRPTILPLPSLLLRIGLGEMSVLLLGGQRALPQRLSDAGFRFRFTEIEPALEDVINGAE